MTPLKPSEKRLLIAFGTAAFILLNLLGFSWYKKRNLALQTQRIKMEMRATELEIMKGQAPEAERKRTFLDQHLQPYADEATREIYLDQFVQKEAGALDLVVRKNFPMPVKLEQHFHKSRYQAEVTGEWNNVLEFIRRLQTPREFRFVPSLSLKSQKKEGNSEEAPDVVCTFEIEKWWSPDSVTTLEESGETPPAPDTAATPVPASPDPATPGTPPPAPAAPEPPKPTLTEQTAASAVKTP